MTKNQLITTIARKTSFTRKQTEELFSAIIDTIEDEMVKGNKVQITGFGTFEVRVQDPRKGRNPFTGESLMIPESRRPAFVPGKTLKEKIKKA